MIDTRFTSQVGRQATGCIRSMLKRGFHCPSSTSAGRWFDAAASALHLSTQQNLEGEAAALLEDRAQRYLLQQPDFAVAWHSLDLRQVFVSLLGFDPENSEDVARGAGTFHLARVSALTHAATTAALELSVEDVILSGGYLVNEELRTRLADALRQAGLYVHVPEATLCGDISLAFPARA